MTEPARLDADEDLIGAGLGDRHVLDLERTVEASDDGGLHGGAPSASGECRCHRPAGGAPGNRQAPAWMARVRRRTAPRASTRSRSSRSARRRGRNRLAARPAPWSAPSANSAVTCSGSTPAGAGTAVHALVQLGRSGGVARRHVVMRRDHDRAAVEVDVDIRRAMPGRSRAKSGRTVGAGSATTDGAESAMTDGADPPPPRARRRGCGPPSRRRPGSRCRAPGRLTRSRARQT